MKYNKPNLRLVKFKPKKHLKEASRISRLVILTSLKIALFGKNMVVQCMPRCRMTDADTGCTDCGIASQVCIDEEGNSLAIKAANLKHTVAAGSGIASFIESSFTSRVRNI